ncbi:MAG: Smr/MutS family protein [Cryomorphaceae bacterium]
MEIKVGDTVRLIDDPEQGIVTALTGKDAMVEIDGMDLPFTTDQLVKVEHDGLITNIEDHPELSAKDKLHRSQGREKLRELEPQSQAVYELDLHIHELLDHYANMSNGEILQYQMGRCRSFVREAMDKRFGKIVLIHGVGEGVLKNEIHKYLDQQSHLEYHDAPYRTYGYGATEVIIHR